MKVFSEVGGLSMALCRLTSFVVVLFLPWAQFSAGLFLRCFVFFVVLSSLAVFCLMCAHFVLLCSRSARWAVLFEFALHRFGCVLWFCGSRDGAPRFVPLPGLVLLA